MHSNFLWNFSVISFPLKKGISVVTCRYPSFLISTHHLHSGCCFLSCSDSCFCSGYLICLILHCCLCWKTDFCYLNLNNFLPCSFSFLCGTALFCSIPYKSIQKNLFLFFEKTLDFFQPFIYDKDIEDMFIFDYNPLLIYLYSPQKEQISLSALFTLLFYVFENVQMNLLTIFLWCV